MCVCNKFVQRDLCIIKCSFASGEKGIKMCVWRESTYVCDRKKKNVTTTAGHALFVGYL